MSGEGKTASVVLCLVFGIPFGAVGVFATWAIVGSALDWKDAQDWVRVRANVSSYSSGGGIKYHYAVGGREYEGTRYTIAKLDGGDNLSGEAEDRLQAALSEKKPVMVFVNPANPAQATIDRELPLKMMLFLTPFSLAFGGVGLGAFWMLFRVLRGEDPAKAQGKAPAKGPRKSDAAGSMIGTWVFTFLWNAIAFPIAIIAVPELWATKEYWGLFVLLFPLIGLFLLWAALAATYNYLRRGGATLHLNPENPRAGSALQGFIAFPRGVAAGESFKVRLVCNRVTKDSDGDSTSVPKWTREHTLRTTMTPQGVRLAFRVEVPSDVPGGRRKAGEAGEYKWRLEATPAEAKRALPYGFEIAIGPAPADAFETPPATAPDEEPRLAPLGPEFAKLQQLAEARGIRLTDDQRDKLATLTADQRELAVKALQYGPKLKKIVIWIVVAVVGFQILTGVIAVVTAFAFN